MSLLRMYRASAASSVDLRASKMNADGVNELQYNFRMNALAGNLPGVKKASW